MATVLVKVGDDGLWALVKTDLSNADRMTLLKALRDGAFEVELRDVPLSKCAVKVCASTSKRAPSIEEESAARALEGAETLGDVAAGLAGNLFIHVQLPAKCEQGTRHEPALSRAALASSSLIRVSLSAPACVLLQCRTTLRLCSNGSSSARSPLERGRWSPLCLASTRFRALQAPVFQAQHAPPALGAASHPRLRTMCTIFTGFTVESTCSAKGGGPSPTYGPVATLGLCRALASFSACLLASWKSRAII